MILAFLFAIAAILVSGFLTALWLVGKSAVTQEASNVLPDATRNLIAKAKDRLPSDARRRYEEEWPAGFEEAIEKRPLWAFREAISLYRGARRIARELEPAPAPALGGRFPTGFAAGSVVAGASRIAAWIRHGLDRLLVLLGGIVYLAGRLTQMALSLVSDRLVVLLLGFAAFYVLDHAFGLF